MSSRDENATDDSAAAAAAAVQTEGMQDGDESGSGEDGEDDDDEEEEVLEPKVLPQRTTRGTRVTSMSGEGDDDFWQQEFFAEEAEADVDYSSSDAEQDDEPDEVDSDFDADEDDDEDDGSEVQADKEATMKKKGAYVDPKQQAAKRAAAAKKAAATKARKAAAAVPQKLGTGEPPSIEYDDDGFPTGTVTLGTGPYAGQGVAAPAADDSSASSKKRSSLPMSVQLAMLPGRKSVRKATVDSTLQTAKKEAADSSRRAKLAAQAKPKVVYRLKTQEEQLADCAATERENIASLEYLQRVEEEKKKELAPKPKPIGPRVRLESKRVPGTDRAEVRLTFTNGQLPEIFSSPALDPAVAAAAAAASPSSSPASPAAAAAPGAEDDAPAGLSPGAADSADELERVADDEESEGEDLLDEDVFRQDYEDVPELDQYEAEGLAGEEEEHEEIDPRARERAERAMAKRERENQRRTGRFGGALDSPVDDEPVRTRARSPA